MAEFEIDKLPPVLQWVAIIGGFVASVIAWFLGARSKDKTDDDGPTRDRLQAAIDDDKLRRDFETILEANRNAFYKLLKDQDTQHMNDIRNVEERLRDVELEQARMGSHPQKRTRE